MILKIWPNGSIISEDKDYNGPELNYGHSDDYFTIDMEEMDIMQAFEICKKHFSGEQLKQVWAELREHYQALPFDYFKEEMEEGGILEGWEVVSTSTQTEGFAYHCTPWERWELHHTTSYGSALYYTPDSKMGITPIGQVLFKRK